MMNSAMDRETKRVLCNLSQKLWEWWLERITDSRWWTVQVEQGIDTEILHKQFQQAYDACVKWGKPYQTVRIHNN